MVVSAAKESLAQNKGGIEPVRGGWLVCGHVPPRLSVNTRALLSAPHYLPVVLHGTDAQEDEQSVVFLLSDFRS